MRYLVTDVPSTTSTARKELGVAWMTYAFTGCSGAVATSAAVSRASGPLPDLGGTSLTAPVVHGIYQLVPAGWTGAAKEDELHLPPRLL